MTTQTTYGECFLISACATIKTLKFECWENDHLFNKDGFLKDHVTDLKETQTKLNKISYSAYVPTLIAQLEYKIDGDAFYIDYEASLYENHETLKELEIDKDLIKDVDSDLNQLQLDIIEAFHNGWGCTALSNDYDDDFQDRFDSINYDY